MKKIVFIITIFFSFVLVTYAHSGNVTGYKEKDSTKISYCNDTYFAFHKKDGSYHYHEVIWNNNTNKWEIVDPNILYKTNPCLDDTSKIVVTLSSCVDGDTAKFIYNDEIITSRFLAVDTPESVHPTKEIQAFGKEASTYTCSELNKATKIELEFDQNSDKFDKYNRYLAWIFVDDILLQEKLIENGYARVYYIYGDYKYTTILENKQIIAQNSNIGIWSLADYQSSKITDINSSIIAIDEKEDITFLIFSIVIMALYLVKKKLIKVK